MGRGMVDGGVRRDVRSGLAIILLLALAFGLASRKIWLVATAPDPPAMGSSAPKTEGVSLAGRADLEALKGRVVLLDFWASWCPPCVAALPTLSAFGERYGAEGLTVLGVNQDGQDEATVRAFHGTHHLNFDSILDSGAIAQRYGVVSLPTSFLIDRAGRVAKMYRGPADERVLRADVETLLAQRVRPSAGTNPP